MVIHAVCFKYKAEIDATTRERHRSEIRGLADMDGVIDMQIGEDIVRSARSYDTGLVMKFTDRVALDSYQKHPRHVPVGQFGISICDSIVVADFEAQ
jgi:hypothetical protein